MGLAVVTGGNKGIGFYIAAQLISAGYDVIISCRALERGEAAAKKLGARCTCAQLNLDDTSSIASFAKELSARTSSLDVLVNNAGIAFKNSDPTPFAAQTRPTLQTNFEGTVAVTEALLPLLRASAHSRVVNVASMAGRLTQLSPELQAKFASPMLTVPELRAIVAQFEADVAAGVHRQRGWSTSTAAPPACSRAMARAVVRPRRFPRSPARLRVSLLLRSCTGNSNYGLSKLAVIAYTNVLARSEPTMRVNSCCPGYCDTDMTSHSGPRPAEEGARTPVALALLPDDGPTGSFWENQQPSKW
jgi:carbonyl reductase 1